MRAHPEALTDRMPSPARPVVEAVAASRPAGARTKLPRESAVRRLLVATDTLALTTAFAAVETWGGFDGGQASSLVRDLALLVFGIPVWILLAHAHNLYHAESRRADHGWTEELAPIVQMATLWSWSILLGISLTGIRQVTLPKLTLFWILTVVLLLALRSAARFWARRQEWYLQNAIVVGPALEGAALVRRILRHPEYRINVLAAVDSAPQETLPVGAERRIARLLDAIPMIRGKVGLPELISQMHVDRVIFATGATALQPDSDALCALADLNIQVDLVPTWSDVVGRRLDFHELEGMPLLSVRRITIGRSDYLRKRIFDAVVSTCVLVVISPLLAACAILIKLDSEGPVLFRQRRVGRGDKLFEVYKFRSMRADAEARKQTIAAMNFHGGGGDVGMFKIRQDPRVTRVGRWLRRTSLDELPQLINVLKGDMSLVGPRPLIETEDRQVEGRYRRRLASWPGLTGPWQIHGRSEIPFEEMIDLDYLYVTNWSLWGDVKLMLRTLRVLVTGQGAY